MLKVMMLVVGFLGLASAHAGEDVEAIEVAKGLRAGLTSATVVKGLFPSIVVNSEGEEGYISIKMSELLKSAPKMQTLKRKESPFMKMPISSGCMFVSLQYSDETHYVRVVRLGGKVSSETEVNLKVVMSLGNRSTKYGSIECDYTVNKNDIETHGQGVFSIEYLQENKHIPVELFKFGVDPHQLMLDTSIQI